MNSVVSDPIEDFINLRFGMFLCYNIMSYGANWGEANFDISGFNLEKLDCKQWSVPVKSVTASSGEANRLIDAMQYGTEYKHWEAQSDSLQVITLDLGTPKLIDRLILVPNHRCKPIPEMSLSKGNPLRISTYVSNDNLSFRKVATDRWAINADYRSIRFPETDARFVQLHVHESVEGPAIIAEVEVGLSRTMK